MLNNNIFCHKIGYLTNIVIQSYYEIVSLGGVETVMVARRDVDDWEMDF
jgi:hypothetical protein